MTLSIDQNASPQPFPEPQGAGRQQQGADLEDAARQFRRFLAAPDSSLEPAGGAIPTRDSTGEERPVAHPPGSLSARDLAMAALWSNGANRAAGPDADPHGAPEDRVFRSRRLDAPGESAIGSAVVWSQAAQPIPQGPQTATPVADPSLSLAALIEIHVRRTLLSMSADGTGTEEVRIDLSDAVLPGMSLALRRRAGGWQLSAVADNSQSLERLTRFAPALVKRFAAASLGSLEILTALEPN